MQVGNPPARPATLVGPASRHPTVPSNPPVDDDILTALDYAYHTHFEALHGNLGAGNFVEALHYLQELIWYRLNHALVAGNNIPQWAQNMENTLDQRIATARQFTQNRLRALKDSSDTISRIAAKAYNGTQGHGGGAHRYTLVVFTDGTLPTDPQNGPLPPLHRIEDIRGLSAANLHTYLVKYGYRPGPNGNLPQGLPERQRALRDAIGAHVRI
ncbi:hypothetical protein EV121DRAFT_194746 [Schizophyllum commune]